MIGQGYEEWEVMEVPVSIAASCHNLILTFSLLNLLYTRGWRTALGILNYACEALPLQ
jgi:hypothetical protein